MRLTHTNRLTPEQAVEVRRLYAAGGVSQGSLARRYGVSQTLINSLVLNKTYREEKNDEPK
jgi:DNA-binding transcriptional regulator LsrR (DeoR family)